MNIIESVEKFRKEHGRAFACIVAFLCGLIIGAILL